MLFAPAGTEASPSPIKSASSLLEHSGNLKLTRPTWAAKDSSVGPPVAGSAVVDRSAANKKLGALGVVSPGEGGCEAR